MTGQVPAPRETGQVPAPPPGGPGHDRGPDPEFAGRIATTIRDSEPWWPAPARPPAGAPNIVVILLDDLGFSDLGCFGAELHTPTIDRLAAGGLRFTGYTTVPMCTPARAALLTGKNPHSVGAGWLTANLPGYPGYQAGEISHDVPTLAEILQGAGYGTIAVGKWHNTPTHLVSHTASRASWPTHRGFDRFYGALAAEFSYFEPEHLVEGDEFVDIDDYPEGFYSTEVWTDRAISYLKQHLAADPDRPFFLYLAENAPHQPLHVRPEDRAAARGRYDEGWDAARQARFDRQLELGIVDDRHRLPPHTPAVPDWASMTADQRRLCARYMELYAGVVEAVDRNVGRLVDFLESVGKLDDTLILITSDNGANGVGGPYGNPNRTAMRYGFVLADDDPRLLAMVDEDRLGGPESAPAYPVGWTEVSNTPFRLFKRFPMNGGIRVPMVAHWPAGIATPGQIRHEWVHVTDVTPTLVEVAGIPYPEAFGGQATRPVDGTSFAPALIGTAAGDRPHPRQHYELQGNRAMIDGTWKIVSLQPPDAGIDLDNWMLFDLAADPCETEDVAGREPEVLARLAAAFNEDARANWVYPLDNRGPRRIVAVPPPHEDLVSRPRTFYPGTPTVPQAVVAGLVADRDYLIRARFTHAAGDEGVIFALGESLAGFALYVLGGQLRFAVARWPDQASVVTTGLPGGEFVVDVDHRALGGLRGRAVLSVNGERWCEVDMSPTMARVGIGLDVGCDRGHQVSPEYRGSGSFPYGGTVTSVEVVPGPQAPGTIVNLSEIVSQRS